jgi:hypothetical protein
VPALSLKARASKKRYAYGEAVELVLEVKNGSKRRLYLVAQPQYIWRVAPQRVRVLFAETEPAPQVAYYNYIAPALRPVGAARTVTLHASIGMPPREGKLDARGVYYWEEQPVNGDAVIEVALGYLPAPFRPASSAPWSEFFSQQTQTAFARIKVHLEPPVK